MFTRLSLIISCFFFIQFTFSQKEDQFSSVETKYVDYFSLDPETIYTHLNKSKYLVDEKLWFKSYLYNTKTQNPYVSTTNVYAALYNDKGQLIEKKLYYAQNGVTSGDFELKKKLKPGIYFLKVFTNWSKNFNEKHYSLNEFEVIGNELNPTVLAESSEQAYDLQLLPEGGNLILDVVNTIGFKILDKNAKGFEISGVVKDSDGKEITTFKSNEFGIGKFNILIESNKSYTVNVTLMEGSIIEKPISNTKNTGIIISVNNLNPENLFVHLKTNVATLPDLLSKTFYLAIHRDGLIKKIDINFENDKIDYVLSIPKNELYSGINVLTLFSDKQEPVLERLIYNTSNELIDHIQLSNIKKSKDSVEIRFRSSSKDTLQKNISISVLPATTKSYEFTSTIQSAFLLEPYLKGRIENVTSYFENNDRKTVYNLDLLLLTQGWTRYDWKNIFYVPQKPYFNFEAGIEIKGKINSANIKNESQVILVSKENELIITEPIDANNNFYFSNLFILDSTSISLSIQNKKQNLSYSGVYYNISPIHSKDSINLKHISKRRKTATIDTPKIIDFIYDNTVSLDTVSISTNLKKPKNQLIHGSFNPTRVDLESTYVPTSRILEIIRQNGFDVRQYADEIQITTRSRATFSGPVSPNIYLDNVPLNGYLTDLQYMTADEIEELYISTSPSVNSIGGNIHIFTKKTYKSKSAPSDFNSSIVDFGFSIPHTYYSPMYNQTEHKLFSDYGVIQWLPNIQMDDNGEFVFKIPNYMYESINLYIEGLCSNGSLISTIETINLL